MDWLIEARRRCSRVGLAGCVMVAAWLACNTALSVLLLSVTNGNPPAWALLLISSGPLYVVAMPLAVLVMRAVPALPTRRFVMSPGRFLTLLLMCLPIMYAGNIVGTLLSSLLSGGMAVNAVGELVMRNDPWTALFVAVLAPIFEEWLFRKQIISRTRRYGERLAIVLSALMFALFHLNLFQFFYAFGLGLMFGYVYTRTSNLLYPIAMHMVINLNGGVLAPWVLSQVDYGALELVSSGDVAAAEQALRGGAMGGLGVVMLYGLALVVLSIAGLVLLIAKRRSFVFYRTPEELPREAAARTVFGNPGVVAYIVITVLYILASLVLPM